MLVLRRLTMQDFGPYKGTQTVSFPDSGVGIVYGANQRGKSTLLNALRYAFLGKVLDRSYQDAPLHHMVNLDQKAVGKYGFKVILELELDGVEYELTRSFEPRRYVQNPQGDNDYEQKTVLKKSGSILGKAEGERELAYIMPEQVARFFLFDGELLQQYEDLVRSQSDSSRLLTESIERILGVPVLTNAKTDCQSHSEDALRQLNKAAEKEQKTQEFTVLIDAKIEQRKALKLDGEALREKLEDANARKLRAWKLMEQDERAAAMLVERRKMETAVQQIDDRIVEKRNRRQEVLTDAWRGMLYKRAQAALAHLQTKIDTFQKGITRKAVIEELLKSLNDGLDAGCCGVCEQPVYGTVLDRLEQLRDRLTDELRTLETANVDELIAQAHKLRSFTAQDKSDLVAELTDQIEDLVVERADSLARIAQIDEDLGNIDKDAIQRARSDYERAVAEADVLSKKIDETQKKVEEISEKIRDLQKKLELAGGGSFVKERRRCELYSQLVALLEEGVDKYREQLRSNVEKDASDLFLNLTSEPDYGGLQINSAYGLTIIHKDGRQIITRSAGAEHVVALALMGALHKNAPLSGPIVMDSPFIRLDTEHKANIVKALPTMSQQVLLLAIDSELTPQGAREQLLGDLKCEYKLVRHSAVYTTIEEV